jgi:catechol-2,3-dioxygenase
MRKVTGLGHLGLHVYDYPKMRDFYARVMGMQVTDEDEERQMCFLSARPDEEHHELLLNGGRNTPEETKLVQQISFTVESIAVLKEFREILEAEALPIDSISTHGNTASVYFRDPEGNRLEVYYSIPVEWPQPFRKPINLDQDDDAVLQQIHDLTFGATVK